MPPTPAKTKDDYMREINGRLMFKEGGSFHDRLAAVVDDICEEQEFPVFESKTNGSKQD